MGDGQPLLVGVRPFAARLGIGRDAAYALVREGRIRSIRLGRKVLIPVAELERFVEREAGPEGVLESDEPEREAGL